uniref:nicotinate phosphoribosyltransferase n=1 Tax=Herpetomonas muscarum TaxID=5718 RepID=T1YTU9_HERMU|nr:nicotinate phosphoribosyltransferase [Herpetomonas muscarum]
MSTDFKPVITSFLDTDAYKLHMQQAVFHEYPQVAAAFEFNCRNHDDNLGIYAEEIRRQIDHLANVRLTEDEYAYLATLPHFKKDYLEYLRNYRYKPQQVTITAIPAVLPEGEVPSDPYGEGGAKLAITVDGPWLETILWEIPLLSITSEVAQRARHPDVGPEQAVAHLHEKLDALFAAHPAEELERFRVTDFGTRRRFSQAVQEAIVRALHADARFSPYLAGTSNYDIARRLGIPAVGTQAHEWFQAFQQLSAELRFSQKLALEMWLKEYPNSLGIALTDCITMDAFLNDFSLGLATRYAGLRQDSGDPVEWARKAITHYRVLGIDPKTKVLVFSDGLDLEKGATLYRTFKDETNIMCGIGTQLTCSMKGVRPMNIVVKMVRCQGRPVAKVSDSPGKSMCQDEAYVQHLMQVFNVQMSPISLSSPATQGSRMVRAKPAATVV